MLKDLKREDWLEGEFKSLEDPDSFKIPEPEKLYMRIKNIRSLEPQNLAVMCELISWREQEAQTRDCLAKNIVRDEPLLELARKAPTNIEGLNHIRGLHRNEISRSKYKILSAIQRGLNLPKNEIPQLPIKEMYNAPPGVEELITAFVQIRADELQIEPSVLAGRKRIHDFVKCFDQNLDMKNHSLLCGWRKEAIGDLLYALLKGQSALAIGTNGKLQVFSIKKNFSKN